MLPIIINAKSGLANQKKVACKTLLLQLFARLQPEEKLTVHFCFTPDCKVHLDACIKCIIKEVNQTVSISSREVFMVSLHLHTVTVYVEFMGIEGSSLCFPFLEMGECLYYFMWF